MNLSSNSIPQSDLGPLLEELHLGPKANHPLIRNGHLTLKDHNKTEASDPKLILEKHQEKCKPISSKSVRSSLPDELIELIIEFVCTLNIEEATQTLKTCLSVSSQFNRIIIPKLNSRPMIDMGSRKETMNFLSRMSDELIDYQLDLMHPKSNPSPPHHTLIGQMKKLIFIGQPLWRHESIKKDNLVNRELFHEILNRIWSTQLDTLVFIELPFTNSFSRQIVNRYPITLTTVIMLTPLSPFQLLFFLRELPNLNQLCIGSRDDSTLDPDEHHTLFSRDQLPSSNLISFGISARTSERWLKTGTAWLENILNLIIIPSLLTIKTLHLELADDDDQRHLLDIFFPIESNPLHDPLNLNSRRSPTQLHTLYLRGISSSLMSHTLSRCQGIKRLCLSSIYGTALRSSSHQSSHPQTLPLDPSLDSSENEPPPLGLLRTRSIPTENPVWSSIPNSIEELSIDITRLPGHGPWNSRSTGTFAQSLSKLIISNQCPNLIRLGSFLSNEEFQFGLHATSHQRPMLDEVQSLIQLTNSNRISLVKSMWSDSFVPVLGAHGWYNS